MIRSIRTLLMLMFLAVVLLAGRTARARVGQPGDGPIHRPFAVVTVKGDALPELRNVPIDRLRVYRARADGDGFEPVPFQVDQRDEKGELLFPLGPKPDRVDPADGLANVDDLLLMAFDAGAPMTAAQLAQFPAPRYEIRVADRTAGADGSVVVFEDDGTYPLSAVDYVSFDADLHRTTAIGYELGSQPGSPALVEYMVPHQTDTPRNILDRMKMRGEAYLFMDLIHIRRTEADIVSTLTAYIDGPVRVVRKMDYALRAIWSIKTPTVERQTPAYAYHAEFPNKMKVPFRLGTIFSDLELVSGFDFRPEMGAVELYTDDFDDPVLMDGKMTERERQMNRFYPLWWVATGDFGCMMFYIVLNDDLRETGVEATLDYTDDMSIPYPPENVPGAYGQALYRMSNVLDMPKGTHNFNVIFYFQPECRHGMEKDALVDWDDPVDVEVRPGR